MNTTATTFAIAIGDRVTPINDPAVPAQTRGRVFVVRKINPKTISCDATDGGRGIRFPPELLVPADENTTTLGVPYVAREHFALGEIVTLARPYREWTTETPLVVTGGRERVNVTPLGGDGDRYLRVSPSGLVRRDRSWLAEQLLEETTS